MNDNQDLPRVVLPGIRTARAREKFMVAATMGKQPAELFELVIDALEEGASLWGHACPLCRQQLVVSKGGSFPDVCPGGHDISKGSMLLIGWEPVQ